MSDLIANVLRALGLKRNRSGVAAQVAPSPDPNEPCNPSTSISQRLPGGVTNFYDIAPEVRQELVQAAIRRRETLVSRWRGLEHEQTDAWSVRARCAAEMLGAQRAVVDLGCGMMTLEQFLLPGTRYIPVDVVRRDERTVIADLNRAPLPNFDSDALAGLGLLEYLYDVPGLLTLVAARYRTAVLSYNPLETVPDRAVRTGHAWVNHFEVGELERLFADAGLYVEDRARPDATQTLWKLTGSGRLSA